MNKLFTIAFLIALIPAFALAEVSEAQKLALAEKKGRCAF